MIDPGVMEGLRRLGLVARRRFRGSGSGERGGAEPGGRTEFSGHRAYEPGEDFRDIDWNLYARHDQLFVREFRREEGIPVRVVLDLSESMSQGRPAKFEFSRQVAAGLGIIALIRHHPVAVWAAEGSGTAHPHHFQGPSATNDLLAYLGGLVAGGRMDLGGAVEDLMVRAPAPALSFWITDGYGGQRAWRAITQLPRRSQDPVFLLVSAREEVDPGWDGNVRLEDVETSEGIDVALGLAEREAYRRAYARYVEEWRARCLASGVRFAWLVSDQTMEEVFFRVLARSGIVS